MEQTLTEDLENGLDAHIYVLDSVNYRHCRCCYWNNI